MSKQTPRNLYVISGKIGHPDVAISLLLSSSDLYFLLLVGLRIFVF